MRTVRNKKPLPLGAMGLPTAAEFNVRLNTLRCKVLVFHNCSALRKGWRKLMGHDLGPRCDGAVSELSTTVEDYRVRGKVSVRREVDRHFFAIIGLHRKALDIDTLAHEACHAGLAYTRRLGRRNPWREQARDCPGERLAYPVGRIANEMIRGLRAAGCFD